VTGRVIIDTQAFGTFNPHRAEAYDDLEDGDYTVSDNSAAEETAINKYATEGMSSKISLTEYAHLICKGTLLGYSMKMKKWSKIPHMICITDHTNFIKCAFSLRVLEKSSGMIMPSIL
jgi:hypothetical protein